MTTKSMTEAVCRALVYKRSGGVCERCGLVPAESVHHRKRRSQRGAWWPSNCLHLCGTGSTGCHGDITNTRTYFYDNGWLVKSTKDPRLKPVLLHCGTFYLDDTGQYVEQPERRAHMPHDRGCPACEIAGQQTERLAELLDPEGDWPLRPARSLAKEATSTLDAVAHILADVLHSVRRP